MTVLYIFYNIFQLIINTTGMSYLQTELGDGNKLNDS